MACRFGNPRPAAATRPTKACAPERKLLQERSRGEWLGVILGLGNDICEIVRVEKTLARYGERFTLRCFTAIERAKSDRRAQRAASYAKRFAAKEACAKALGTGLSRGVFWRDIGVVNLPSGKPTIRLANGAARALARLVPAGHEPHIHLTMTDDGGMAQAFVIIEALPVDRTGTLP